MESSRLVEQAFLVNGTTLPGLVVGVTNLHEKTIAGKNLKMELIEGGLAVSGQISSNDPVLNYFIPASNIKSCKLY